MAETGPSYKLPLKIGMTILNNCGFSCYYLIARLVKRAMLHN